MRIREVTAGALAALWLVLPSPAEARDGSLLALGFGAYNVLQTAREAEFRLEYRSALTLARFFRPILGMFATDRGSFLGYAGLRIDVPVGEHVVLTPEAAVGYWRTGGGKDLGSPLEFKTGGEIAWRFANDARLGLAFDHISNGGLRRRNPGAESVVLVYSLPLGFSEF